MFSSKALVVNKEQIPINGEALDDLDKERQAVFKQTDTALGRSTGPPD